MMNKKIMVIVICTSFLISGCGNLLVKSLLPEEIVEAAIERNENEDDYYIKSTTKIFEKDELLEEFSTKEWSFKVDGQVKRRTEMASKEEGMTISLVDEKEITIYQEDTNEVFTLNNTIEGSSNLNKSLKEKTISELDMAKKMYDVKNLGEVDINGRDTYHLKGVPLKESTLLGDYEIWIDKENWIVVKSISKSGDMEIITENIEVDFSPKIDNAIFDLEIPEDAKIVDLDEDVSDTKEVTLEEANEKLDGKLLYIKDEKYKLEKAVSSTYNSDMIPDEMVFNYSKDGQGLFTISVLKKQAEMEDDGVMEFREKEIRGNKAYIIEDIIKMISFYEEGLQYNLIIEDDGMTIDEGVEIIENMVNF